MTEVERYEKRDPAKSSGLSGARAKLTPQEAWMELIVSSVPEAPSHLRQYMQTISTLSNIPRKEKQFRNFTANSLNLGGGRQHAEKIVSDIWSFLCTLREKQQKQRQQQKQGNDSGASQGNLQKLGGDAADGDNQETEIEESDDRATKPITSDIGARGDDARLGAPENAGDDETTTVESVSNAMQLVLAGAKGGMSKSLLRRAVRRHLNLAKQHRTRIKLLVKQIIGRKTREANGKDRNSKSTGTFRFDGKIVTLTQETSK
jgi:hypothetical protein